jgi:hypothetical protein
LHCGIGVGQCGSWLAQPEAELTEDTGVAGFVFKTFSFGAVLSIANTLDTKVTGSISRGDEKEQIFGGDDRNADNGRATRRMNQSRGR